MSKDDVKDIADMVCTYAMDISWGFLIQTYWDGDVLVFRNDPDAIESWWGSMVDDICETCGMVCELVSMEYVEIDDEPERAEDIKTFRCGLKWKED